jgi:dihydroorotate dehydrogenase electron transfer subunit
MQQKRFTIAENAPVARGTYRLRLTGDTAAITAPGQFADIRLAGYFLRRPVSVCSWSDGALTLILTGYANKHHIAEEKREVEAAEVQ